MRVGEGRRTSWIFFAGRCVRGRGERSASAVRAGVNDHGLHPFLEVAELHAATARRNLSAFLASLSTTSKAGTSSSHSYSVATRPVRFTAWA